MFVAAVLIPFSTYMNCVAVVTVYEINAPDVHPVLAIAKQPNEAAEEGHPVPMAMIVAACGDITQLLMDTTVPGYSVVPASNTPQP